MNDADYKAILQTSLARLAEIAKQQAELESEAAKLYQFMMATANMLPDDERLEFVKLLEEAGKSIEAGREGLKQAVQHALRQAYPRWLTAAQVRDALVASGFSFERYMSNPLASVSTTLRRMKSSDVQTAETDGVTAYRWKRLSDRMRDKALKGKLSDMK